MTDNAVAKKVTLMLVSGSVVLALSKLWYINLLTLLHTERRKLRTIFAFLRAMVFRISHYNDSKHAGVLVSLKYMGISNLIFTRFFNNDITFVASSILPWLTEPFQNRVYSNRMDGWHQILRLFQQYFSHIRTMEYRQWKISLRAGIEFGPLDQ